MTVLTADALQEVHPMLPDDWKRSMGGIRNDGGPWECNAASCGGPSYLCYRCSKCGHDPVGDGSTASRQGVNR